MFAPVVDEPLVLPRCALSRPPNAHDREGGRWGRTTSSDMTIRLWSHATRAMPSSSARENTLPTGLCGVLSTIIVTAHLRTARDDIEMR